MPIQKPSRKRLRSMCAEVSPEDGSDPRIYFRKEGSRGKPGHKAYQLCRQVAEVLEACFEAPRDDDLLGDLTVAGVSPAPDAASLLVTVTLKPASLHRPAVEVLGRLDRAGGWLRSEVARAITRKRAPLLIYRVLEAGPGPDSSGISSRPR